MTISRRRHFRSRLTTTFLLILVPLTAAMATLVGWGRADAVLQPTISISDATPFPIAEGDVGTANVSFSVTLSSSPPTAVSVSYATMYGSATPNVDYTYQESTLNFAAGASGPALTQTIVVPVTGDTNPESDENFFIQLYSESGGTLGDRWGEAQITDNDAGAPLTLSVGDPIPASEGNAGTTSIAFPVTISALPASGSVTTRAVTGYGSASPGTDYVSLDTTLTWTPSSTLTQNVTVTINGDTASEPDETFWLQLYDPVGVLYGDRWGRHTILNDDAPAPVISIADGVAAEGANIPIVVTLSATPSSAVTVNYTTMPGNYFDTNATPTTDFAPQSGVLTWASGASGAALIKTINVAAIADGSVEPSEHFWLQIYDPAGASLAAQRYGKGTISAPPVAVNDSYTAVGNTHLVVATTAPPTPNKLLAGPTLLANDTDAENDALTVSGPATTTQGGTLSLNANGSFVYLPAVGFAGADSFTYTVSDGQGNTATGVVNITVGTKVWYVDNALGVNGTGRSNSPFNTLASLQGADPDGTGDFIFLYQGSGNYAGGLALETDQQLIGQPQTLVVDAATLRTGDGSNPTITNTGGAGITLANNNTIRRVSVSGTSGAGITGTSIATADIGPNLTVSGAAGNGFNLTGSATGNITMAGSITHSASGARSVSISNRTGGTVTMSGALNDTAGGIAISTNAGATVSFTGGVTISSGANTAFAATGGGTVNLTGSTNSAGTTTGTAVNINATTIGASGVTFQTVSTTSGTSANGILLDTVGAGNFTANTGSLTVNTRGLDVNGGTGDVTIGTTITTSGAAARSVEVTSHTGGTVDMNGLVTDTSLGINLTGNTGATIRFDGGITASTGTNTSFNATGGGTIAVTDTNGSAAPNNTLTSTGAVTLNVANTTIHADDLTFQSISAGNNTAAADPASGIVLNTTGSSGGLTVTGIGTTDGSGGTIQNTTARGVNVVSSAQLNLSNMTFTNAATADFPAAPTGLSLGNNTADNAALHIQSTNGVTLTNVDIAGSAEHGINLHEVTAFSLVNSSIVNAGNGPDEDGIHAYNLRGTNAITNTTIASSGDDNVNIQWNDSLAPANDPSGSITVTGGSFNTGVLGSGLLFGIRAQSNIAVLITGVTINNNFSGGVVADTFDTATSDIEVTGATITNNNDAIAISSNSGNTDFDIHDNPNITLQDFVAISILKAAFSTGGSLEGYIRNNPNIDVENGHTADAITVFNAGGGPLNLVIANNNIDYAGTQRAINLQTGQDGAGALHVTATNNVINIQLDGVGNALNGILANSGVADPSGAGSFLCVDIGGAGALSNTFTHSLGGSLAGGDIRVRQRFSNNVRLPGYGGGATDTTAVATYLDGRNAEVSPSTATFLTGTFVGGGACNQPSP